jgi:hypothetical protein
VQELDSVTEKYLQSYCKAHPTQAVWLGFHEYDGRLPDLARPALEARAADLEVYLSNLARIDPAPFEDLAWLDYQVVHYHASFERFDLTAWRRWERDPFFYLEPLNVSNYVLRDYAPLPQRAHALVAHLEGLPLVLQAMRANLSRVSRPALNFGLRLAEGMVAFFRDDLPLAMSGLEEGALQDALESAIRTAITHIEDAIVWMKDDLAPRSTADFALGADVLSEMLRLGEAVHVPLERLRQVAAADLARNKAAFLETAAAIAPGRAPQDVIAEGARDHPSPKNLVVETRQMVDDLRRFVIERGLVSVPYDENCVVAETPPFLRFAFAMLDSPGPFEKVAKEAYYYVTPPAPDWPEKKTEEWMTQFAYHVLRGIAVHEAWPGHFLHSLHMVDAPSPVTKAFGAYSAYEAWAHYCEQMMLEAGWRDGDPWARLGQLSEALIRNVRFVCALGLHTEGMTIEEAKQRFIDDAFMEPATAQEEALRGTGDPQYLGYTLGKLMLIKLRDDLKARDGDEFDLRAFHDHYLSFGAPPVPLVRALMLGRDDEEVL